jgi:hypothetical protein
MQRKGQKLRAVPQDPIDNLPRCFSMDIDTQQLRERGKIVLRLTAHFNQDSIPSGLGNLLIAVSGGDLLLDLNNVQFVKHILYGQLPRSVEKKTSVGRAFSQKEGLETTRKPSTSIEASLTGPKTKLGYGEDRKNTHNQEVTAQQEDEITYEIFQVNALGGKNPGWRFKLKTGDPYLEGSIVDEKICECQITDIPGSIGVTFDVHQRFVEIQILDGFFRQNEMHRILSAPKLKILDLLLWHRVVKKKMLPHLSSKVIRYE